MSSETDMMDTGSAGSGVAAGPLITLTRGAADKVREFQAASPDMTVLRVSVIPGGCSGFEYGLDMDDQVREDDFEFASEGIRVVVDPFSAQYLTGVRIGYQSSFQGTGFTFENPNATGSCGCGSSFST